MLDQAVNAMRLRCAGGLNAAMIRKTPSVAYTLASICSNAFAELPHCISEKTPARNISPTKTSATLSARSRNIMPSPVELNQGMVAVGPTFRQFPAMSWSTRGTWNGTPSPKSPYHGSGGVMFTFLLWFFLLIFCWPLALMALILYPLVWLLLLPFRILGIAVDGVFELLKAILMLPARVLRGPSRATLALA